MAGHFRAVGKGNLIDRYGGIWWNMWNYRGFYAVHGTIFADGKFAAVGLDTAATNAVLLTSSDGVYGRGSYCGSIKGR